MSVSSWGWHTAACWSHGLQVWHVPVCVFLLIKLLRCHLSASPKCYFSDSFGNLSVWFLFLQKEGSLVRARDSGRAVTTEPKDGFLPSCFSLGFSGTWDALLPLESFHWSTRAILPDLQCPEMILREHSGRQDARTTLQTLKGSGKANND